MYNKKGFTLIELLVVIGILSAVAAVAGSILSSSLRGSDKTLTLDQVRQNGNYALILMTKMIRGAKSASCPNTTSVKIVAQDNLETTFACGTNITSNSANLLNPDAVSVVANTCSFTCTQAAGQPSTVQIKFTLSEAGTTTFVEKKATVPFETSVTLRNQ